MTSIDVYESLIRTLTPRDDLSPEDASLIRSLAFRQVQYGRGAEIIKQDSIVSESCLIIKGWAGRAVYLENGKRQITALHIAGDFVDLHGFTLKYMDHSVLALTSIDVAFVGHEEVRRVTEQSPHLARLLWTLTTVDGAIQRTMIASLGRRQALERLGHLLCELDCRLSAVDLANNHCFEVPLTQEDLADILGLSSVHMNRMIQELRQSGFITWQGQKVALVNLVKLEHFAGFDGRYLNYMKRPR
jgi:CRP-like cAMP-binding protein